MKKEYIKPEQSVVVLQYQCHLLAGSGQEEVRSLRGGFNLCGGDSGYDEDAR